MLPGRSLCSEVVELESAKNIQQTPDLLVVPPDFRCPVDGNIVLPWNSEKLGLDCARFSEGRIWKFLLIGWAGAARRRTLESKLLEFTHVETQVVVTDRKTAHRASTSSSQFTGLRAERRGSSLWTSGLHAERLGIQSICHQSRTVDAFHGNDQSCQRILRYGDPRMHGHRRYCGRGSALPGESDVDNATSDGIADFFGIDRQRIKR